MNSLETWALDPGLQTALRIQLRPPPCLRQGLLFTAAYTRLTGLQACDDSPVSACFCLTYLFETLGLNLPLFLFSMCSIVLCHVLISSRLKYFVESDLISCLIFNFCSVSQ